jgi:hypothetical protein
MEKKNITTKEEARNYAIEWQQWASKQNLSMQELVEWSTIFGDLAEKFDLQEEFKENGII